jgi:hypothetical protein
MKKIIFLSLSLLSIGVVKAQDNSVKVNPLAFFGGSDLVSYERKLTDNITGLVGLGYSSYSLSSYKYTSYGSELQGRYYFSKALKGFYGGAQAGFNLGKATIDMGDAFGSDFNSDTKYTALRFGAKAGYQWLKKSGFTLDLNLGFGYNKYNYSTSSGSTSLGLSGGGIRPNLGFGLGYSF